MLGCEPLSEQRTLPRSDLPGATSYPPIKEEPPRVLIIEDDRERLEFLAASMEQEGYVTQVTDTSARLDEFSIRFQPDAVLLGMIPSRGEFYQLCGDLRTMEPLRNVPVVLVSWEEADDEQVARALLAGADDFIPCGRPLELRARMAVRLRNKRYRDALRRVRSQRDILLRQATVDPLTGILNRRPMEDAVNSLFMAGAMFGFLFLDIDHFKRVNDRYGHDAGDQVLRGIADYLKKAIRAGDFCGRFGGEEFVVLVHGADLETAERIAERHRQSIGRIRYSKIGPGTAVTVSIGVAVYDPVRPDIDPPALLRRADSALYEAKRLGRNQVVMAALARNIAESPSSDSSHGTPVISLRPSEPEHVSILCDPQPRPSAGATCASVAIELELVRKLDSGRAALPVLPTAAAEALRLAADPDANVGKLASLLDHDPHFAARFLSLANSAIYSRGIRTTTMRDAIVRIGLAAARDLLFQIVYAASTFGMPRYQEAVSRSFHRSVLSALAARSIDQAARKRYPYAYLCGLLHDIGEARVYRLLASLPQAPRDPDVVDELVARYHCRAGAELAVAWRLPSDISEVCLDHHARPDPTHYHVQVAIASDALVEVSHLRPDDPVPDALLAPIMATGFPADALPAVVESIRQAARTLDG
ncbi:MAG: diguanylate cyclase [Deltaproteobacteria bacterium]|nr:diguanylate cyclase [Deltaproteobacteria bacterium]